MAGPSAFGEFMAAVARPMIVVTTAAGAERAGCLVGFHSQSSIEPPQYAVWLSKANRTYRIGVLTDEFALHFLEPQHHALAELFGGTSGDEDDKFARCSWHPSAAGVPLLDDCTARITARRVALHDAGGDHGCFVLEPRTVEMSKPFAPLESTKIANFAAGHAPSERQQPR